MKKVLIILILFISSNVFSQSSTEKWNSYTNRYEYFDRNGNMTAYKQYNSYLKQWETYKVGNSNNSSFEQTQVKSQFNTELAFKVGSIVQARYDNNYNEVVNYATYIKESIKSKLGYPNSSYTKENINFINMLVERFNNETLIPIWKKGYNYGDSSLKESVKQLMRNDAASIIKEVVCCPPNYKYIVDNEIKEEANRIKKINESNSVPELRWRVGNYNVKSVQEFKFVKNKWILVNTDVSETTFNYQNYYVKFKRSYMSEEIGRGLIFKEHNYIAKCYIYESEFGTVFIDEDFKNITFFDLYDSNKNPTNKYIFNL